jgi:hypothetical protein
MGLRDLLAGNSRSKEDLVAERLCQRFEDLHLMSLANMPLRQRVDVCGEIRRMTVKPRAGIPAVEVEISDGTADLTLIFYGRGHVPGIAHNRALTVSGVAFREGSRRVMLNPAYRLLPRPGQ